MRGSRKRAAASILMEDRVFMIIDFGNNPSAQGISAHTARNDNP
jgi:hypothetical protein